MGCLDETTFMALLLGELPPERRPEVDEHLDTCAACRRLVAEALRAQHPEPESPQPAEAPPRPRGADATLDKGTAVGRYLVLEPLGAGAMGVIYSAYDPELDRRVALKLLRVSALGLEEEKGRALLLREAQSMARVSHPNVVPIYDVGTFGDRIFLAMERVEEARTLRAWLAAAPRSWRQVLSVFLDAGRGLAAAHAAGLVHGDFKPENLLVGADGRVRVTDFGLARSLSSRTKDATPFAGGTPAYMAPEQQSPSVPADARTDEFAFCVALYEALHGERPFSGHDARELADEALAGRLRPPPKGTHVPPWVRRVLARGLAASPSDRYAQMESLLAALQQSPGARWHRPLQALGGVALVVIAVGITHSVHAWRARACAGAAEELASVWGPSQQRAIEQAFLATDKPFAAAAWRRVQRELDAYTAAWVTTRTTACEATRLRGDQSEAVMARRMRCLDNRLAEVAALTQLFARADADMVELSARASQELPPISGCSDLTALLAREPLSEDAQARAREEALRHKLIHVRALKAAGKYAQALTVLEPVAKEARDTGDKYAVADALLLLGELRAEAGDAHGAETTLFEALGAAEASRNDAAAARAWTRLVRVTGESLEQYALAHRWKARAEAAIERLGGDDVLRAHLQANVGLLLFAQGQYTEAAEQQEAALARLERAFGPESLEVADVRLDLGSTRIAQLRMDEALQLFHQVLATREKALGPDHPDVARAQLEVAEVHWRRREFPQTEQLAKSALEMLERALGPQHVEVAFAMNSVAAAWQGLGRHEEAVRMTERALAIALKSEGPDNSTTLLLVNNLASLLAQGGQPAAALARLQAILEPMERRLGPHHPYLALATRSIAQLQLRLKHPQEALREFQRARSILEAREDDPYGYWTATMLDLGLAYMEHLGRAREAVPLFELALAGRPHSTQTPLQRAWAGFLLGQALWVTDMDRERAMRLVTEAHAVFAQAGSRGQEGLKRADAWLAKQPRPTRVVAPTAR
ncbi:serine/threonine protein kinase [Corallococcus sp. H22C18031201]|nr:tetratricopeptide repeat protein [Citreicoccus inhibens]RJS21946.1 serine/threonine protein kinase [Corallococcus sp. H22C18031201]